MGDLFLRRRSDGIKKQEDWENVWKYIEFNLVYNLLSNRLGIADCSIQFINPI